MGGTKKDIDGIKKDFRVYVEYFFENPNVFKFFYFHHLYRPVGETGDTQEEPDFDAMWEETFREFVQSGKLRGSDIEVLAKTLIYTIHGLVTLCFSGNGNLTEEKVYKDLDIQNVDLSKVGDGTYTGGYKVFPVAVEVRVRVENHSITEIELVKHTNGQGAPAEVIPRRVIESQSLDVDIVSGATYSSKVILKSIENALKSANK